MTARWKNLKRDERDQADLASDARRLARMLVSEIKLGHEKEVLEGRVHADLYSRLQKESMPAVKPIRDRSSSRIRTTSTKNSSRYSLRTTLRGLVRTTPGPGGLSA